jgi:hypothetical protein
VPGKTCANLNATAVAFLANQDRSGSAEYSIRNGSESAVRRTNVGRSSQVTLVYDTSHGRLFAALVVPAFARESKSLHSSLMNYMADDR